MSSMEYCITCGEPTAKMDFPVAVNLKIEQTYGGARYNWTDLRLLFCPNRECRRYGLLTGLIEPDIEVAKAQRKKFAKDAKAPKPKPPRKAV